MDEGIKSWMTYQLPAILGGFTITAATTGLLLAAAIRWAKRALS